MYLIAAFIPMNNMASKGNKVYTFTCTLHISNIGINVETKPMIKEIMKNMCLKQRSKRFKEALVTILIDHQCEMYVMGISLLVGYGF